MKTFLNIILSLVILILAYLLFDSIMKPIRFNRVKNEREEKIKERLIDIRTAEVAFKAVKGYYTDSFDTLTSFLKFDSLPVVFRRGSLTDDMISKGITSEKEAALKGLITRDTSYIPVSDSIIVRNADSLKYVPGWGNTEFSLTTANVMTTSRIIVNVFEASVLNDIFLKDLDRQLVINYNDQRTKTTGFPGMKIGDIREPNNNAGNWED